MRLHNYITESDEDALEKFNSVIQRSCKPYLKLVKGKDPLYRTMKRGSFKGKQQVRKDRKPRGTSQALADNINKWLEKNGHNRRDQSLITTPNYNYARLLFSAPVFMVFPIGRFSYSWVPSKDWNSSDSEWSVGSFRNYLLAPDMLDDEYSSAIKTDKGFNDAYYNDYEIWFNCKEYYYIEIHPSWVWDQKYGVIV